MPNLFQIVMTMKAHAQKHPGFFLHSNQGKQDEYSGPQGYLRYTERTIMRVLTRALLSLDYYSLFK